MAAKNSDSSIPVIPPYFDILFTRLEANDPATIQAFGRHVHWGYWPQPDQATGTPEDYAQAAETLCRMVCDAANIRDGHSILDVGCGFGGTIASLNERFHRLNMVGVNIDARQLDRARRIIQPMNDNRISFELGDACALNRQPESAQVVLAVECIFHFPDRRAFFQGAAQALVPGGRLSLSDLVPPPEAVGALTSYYSSSDPTTQQSYGRIDVLCPVEKYRELARDAGLELVHVQNISTHTLPTYPFLKQHLGNWPDPRDAKLFDKATSRLEAACNLGMLEYSILAFEKK